MRRIDVVRWRLGGGLDPRPDIGVERDVNLDYYLMRRLNRCLPCFQTHPVAHDTAKLPIFKLAVGGGPFVSNSVQWQRPDDIRQRPA
jgi:hypothetical protein